MNLVPVTPCGGNCSLTGDIDVPATAIPGETRMRVMEKYSSAPTDACTDYTFGEVEDYTIQVESGVCTPPDITYEVVNDCVNDTYNVAATINSLGTSTFVTVFQTRSDGVTASNVTLVPPLVGQTINFVTNIPFGVTVHDSIVGGNEICTLIRNFSEEVCPAENDEICDAISLSCGDALTDMPFVGATQSIDDACFGTGTADVWYTFTSDGSEKYEISFANDVVLSVYQGTSCSDTTLIQSCQDFPDSYLATEAGTYFVRVRPYSSSLQFHDVSLNCIPFDCPDLLADAGTPCDDGNPDSYNDVITSDCECVGHVPIPGEICEVPIDVTTLPYTDSGNTSTYLDDYDGADLPPYAPDVIGSGSTGTYYLNGDDVVYGYTPDQTESLNISVTDHGSYASVFVFTGCPFSSTLGYNAQYSSTAVLDINGLIAQAGVTYYIVISTWPSPQTTDYTLNIESVPFDCPELMANFGSACDDGDPNTSNDVINENCECAGIPIPVNDEACNATQLTCADTLFNQNMIGATPSVIDGCYLPDNGDIWFTFYAEEGYSYNVALAGNAGSGTSSSLTSQIFEGDDCANLTSLLDCNTFSTGYYVTGPGNIYVRVRPYSDAESVDVSLVCAQVPANADCATAEPVDCAGTYTGSTLAAPAYDPNQPFCGTSGPFCREWRCLVFLHSNHQCTCNSGFDWF